MASLGALMALVAGISRTALAMAREGDLPARFTAVSAKRAVPWLAEVSVAAVVVVLLLAFTLPGASAATMLAVFAVGLAGRALALAVRRRAG
jgi:APA family basic amino acid/polyamine antiporter